MAVKTSATPCLALEIRSENEKITGESVASRRLRTYDVFDTVLTRLVGIPAAVFYLVGDSLRRRGIWHGSAEQFTYTRIEAESRARAHQSETEVSINLIYSEFAAATGVSQTIIKSCIIAEIETERLLLRAVPKSLAKIESEREDGYEIAFISDMYLPEAVVRQWLTDLNVAKPGDRLWVSSEYGHSKSNGRLFDVVARELSCADADWQHAGDNVRADVAMPKSRGISARLFDDCHLTPLEQGMERSSAGTAGLGSLLAGASRWTRLSEFGSVDIYRRTMNNYAAEVAGPAVYSFVLWVIQTAQREGITRIWFMARDGQVMIPIAREIARRLHIDVEIGYLYGNRQVVKVAALKELDDAALDWLTGGGWFLSVSEILLRVGVDAKEVHSAIESSGLSLDEAIGWDRMNLLRQLLRHPDVSAKILEISSHRRLDVLEYFRQCGLVGQERCCIVDIGWRGTVAKAIDDLIGRAETAKHLYLYFGLYARPSQCANLKMIGYLFDVNGDTKRGTGSDIPNLTTAMEIFCQADHGSVLELTKQGSEFKPVCRQEDLTSDCEWDVNYFQQRLRTFAENVCIELCADPSADLRAVVEAGLRSALCRPTEEQARTLGSIPFVDDQAGSGSQPFARAYGPHDLREAFRSGSVPVHGINWWTAGAWTLTSRSMRLAVRLAAKAGRLRRRPAELFRLGSR